MTRKQQVIEQYAKKIYAFSYQKAGNIWDAEELSQEIALVLCTDHVLDRDIENMDAYIYRICKYTWSNFVRKNVRHWRSMENEKLESAVSESDPEKEIIHQDQFRQLRQEIAYLSELRRKAMVAYYFDNKKGDEIARELSIPASTVRWHLKQAREIIKERMEMTENTLFQPVRLLVGHYGNARAPIYEDLRHDVLTQNICWACRDRAHTMEEIAQTLGVAAVYLEYKIQQLIDMDYMRRIGSNKYRTAFYIWDDEFQLATERFRYDRALELGLPFYNLIKKHLSEIREIEGIPNENDNFLLWALLPGMISGIFDHIQEEVQQSQGCHAQPPKRSDGSEHWLIARTRFRENIEAVSSESNDFKDYCCNGDVWGVKSRYAGRLESLQYDMVCFGPWRNFESWELLQLQQTYEIIADQREPTESEKEVIANLAQKGYVSVVNGIPAIRIPFLKGNNLRDLITNTLPQFLDLDLIRQTYLDYGKYVDGILPKYVNSSERDFLCTDLAPEAAIMYKLFQDGYLKEPTQEEKLRVCTLVWENETAK